MAKKNKYKWVWTVAGVLVIVGAISLGLQVFNFDLFQWLSNKLNISMLKDIFYSLIGLSGLALIIKKFKK